MASGLPLRSQLSDCLRCLQSQLPRNVYLQPQRRLLHDSVQTELQGATSTQPKGQHPTISHIYPLPRTKVYEHTRSQPRAPVRHRLPKAEFIVNDDQGVLDDMYIKLFGRGPQGAELLPPELRWQAVTHLSFDHGRQPYNNKLAFFGRRILFFYTNLYILNRPQLPTTTNNPPLEIISESENSAGEPSIPTISSGINTYLAPTHFDHADYKNIDAATYDAVGQWTDEIELAKIARGAGLYQVMRWKPKNTENLAESGMNTIAVECLHAIIGAIALSKGGAEARRFVNRLLEQQIQ